jgi:hypothetical protein
LDPHVASTWQNGQIIGHVLFTKLKIKGVNLTIGGLVDSNTDHRKGSGTGLATIHRVSILPISSRSVQMDDGTAKPKP